MENIFSHVQQILIGALGLAIIGVAVAVAFRAKKANYAETAKTGFNVFMAITLAAIGLGAVGFAAFGRQVLSALGII